MSAPVKAYLEAENGDRIAFLFNPETINLARRVLWKPLRSPGKNAPQLSFGHGQSGTLRFEAYFDTTNDGDDVTRHTGRLLRLMDVDPQKKRPPWIRLGWGHLSSFKAVLESADVAITYFASDGVPLRARVTLAMKQFHDENQLPLQNPTSGTPQRDRIHQVRPGETLDRIAFLAYGDPTAWRRIAQHNRVLDPFALRPGTVLVLPEREAAPRGR